MKKLVLIGLTCGVLLATAISAPAVHAEEPLAVIGDMKITNADIDKEISEIPPYAQSAFKTREGRVKILNRLVQTELLRRAAVDAGYENRPDIKEELEKARTRILTSRYFNNEMTNPSALTEEKLRAYYDAHKAEFKIEANASISHILLSTRKEAEEVLKKLKKGELTFLQAVKGYSIDNRTKLNGGRLGNLKMDGYLMGVDVTPEFKAAVFKLKDGELSDPIKTKKGWHIIRMNHLTPEGYKSFDEVKSKLVEDVLVSDDQIKEEYESHPEKYRARAKVKLEHILVADKSKADALYAKLQKGADFGELVQTESIDSSSAKRGGNLGYLYKGGYLNGIGRDPEFEKAVFALKKGEISKPIHSKKGWHIVRVVEKTDAQLKPLSEVKDKIRTKLLRDMKEKDLQDKFDALKKKYQCTVFEDRVSGSDASDKE